MKTFAVIAAGGRGTRFGDPLPKQYTKVDGKELLVYSLEVFQDSDLIDQIVLVTEKNYFDLVNSLKNKYSITKLQNVVEGGIERQDSVFKGLNSLNAGKDDLVAVHDAARPFLNLSILNNAVQEAKLHKSIVVAIKARDTLIQGDDTVVSYADRNKYYYAQTPQIFTYSILLDSMEKAYKNNFYGTDESMLVKNAGYEVRIVNGSPLNFKITSVEDLEIFRAIKKNYKIS